ncbi:hypothetical protein ACJA88_006754 [Fusarium oxysporum]
MAENATNPAALEGSFDALNSTLANGQNWLSSFAHIKDLSFVMLEVRLVLSAIGIIYLGAHAALRRPPSAQPAKKKKPGSKDDDEERFAQGLEPSDAIIFPLMAGAVLIGLLVSIYSHGIEVVTSLAFPRYWRGRDGRLREADQKTRSVQVCDDAGNPDAAIPKTQNPFPGPFACLAFSEKIRKSGWELRGLLKRHWAIKLFIHGMGKEEGRIKFAHVVSLVMALATALIYSSTTSPLLSNMLGYAMCYGSIQLISPTDFLTSTLILVGLFFYDIIMVFYTPYMVTVATKLDVPIKLTFEAAERKSILGLGDIVIPGMVMALALRFDLWLHYDQKIKYESTDLKLIEKDPTSGALITRSETKHKEVKAKYVNVKGKWGDSLWTRGTFFIFGSQQLPPDLAAAHFRKTYFHASVIGYLLGMLVTLAMLLIFKRGQPALLYLVPGVLGSLWLTGLVRGEIKQMWKYTEDGSLDKIDVVVDLDGEGNAIKTLGKLEDGVVDTTKKDEKKDGEDKPKDKEDRKAKEGDKSESKEERHVFLLSVDAEPETE